YIQLDDNDIEFAIKKWQQSSDFVLSDLCRRIQSRKLLKIRLQNTPFDEEMIAEKRKSLAKRWKIDKKDTAYYIFSGQVSNQAYVENSREPILIRYKSGDLVDLSSASDLPNIHALSTPVVKYFYCAPEEIMR
ncbi:MAG: phosphohydrolase, partial [Bacteroidota bacterium]